MSPKEPYHMTKFQKFQTRCTIFQLYRFVIINYKMLRTIFHTHGSDKT